MIPLKLRDMIELFRKKGIREKDAFKLGVKRTGIKRGKNKDGKATWRKSK